MTTSDETLPRPGWALSELGRSIVSALIAFVLTFVLTFALVLTYPPVTDELPFVGPILSWTLFALVHSTATWLTFRGLAGGDLRRAVSYDRRRQREADRRGLGWLRSFMQGGTGAGWSVQVSIIALAAVAVLALAPALRQEPVVLASGLLMVAASWINVASVYTVHYARLDAAAEGMRFVGEEEVSFSDYRYFAVAVQTTFGTTDVDVTTRAMRRVVTAHGALAFVFNTVIVAMIVSLLLGSQTS